MLTTSALAFVSLGLYGAKDNVETTQVWDVGQHNERPFAAILEFPVQEIGRRVVGSLSDINKHSTTFFETLLCELADQFAEICQYSLYSEYCAYRCSAAAASAKLMGISTAPRSAIYDSFCSAIVSNWDGFLSRHPAIADLLHSEIVSWLNAIDNILKIAAKSKIPKRIATFHRTGDKHEGNFVAKVNWESTRPQFFKPRQQGATEAFVSVCDWLHEMKVADIAVPVTQFLTVGALQEEIQEISSDRLTELMNNYGESIAVCYLLGMRDLHFENVVFCNDKAYLIDLETFLSPIWDYPPNLPDPIGDADLCLVDSPLDTGLLPIWEVSTGGLADLSPLTTKFPNTFFRSYEWVDINTDVMSRTKKLEHVLRQRSWLDEKLSDPSLRPALMTNIKAGFASTIEALICFRSELEVLVCSITPGLTRVVLRPTRTYSKILSASYSPKYSSSITRRRDFLLSVLSPEAVAREGRGFDSRITEIEVEALMRGDIPTFYAKWDSVSLLACSGECLERDFFKFSGLDAFKSRLERWNSSSRQVLYDQIDESFSSRFVATDDSMQATSQIPRLLQQIPEILRSRAIHTAAGPNWLSAGIPDRYGRISYEPLDCGCYGGVLGIGAYLACCTGANESWARDTWRGLRNAHVIRFEYAQNVARFVSQSGIGAGSGIGSVIYANALLASLWHDPQLLEINERIAKSLYRIQPADQPSDVISGLAGAVIGLIADFKITGSEAVLAVAVDFAMELANRVDGFLGPREIGFAHGEAGILFALVRVIEYFKNDKLNSAVGKLLDRSEAIAGSGCFFDNRHGDTATGRVNISWCWGVIGELIALVEAARILGDFRSAQSLDEHAQRMPDLSFQLQAVDQVCCGNAGVIDGLLYLYKQTHHINWLLSAKSMQTRLEERAAIHGFRFYPNIDGLLFNASLFRGYAGVAYVAARLSGERSLPSITAFEVGDGHTKSISTPTY